MKSMLRFSLAFSLGLSVCADAVDFPAGGGDLASADSWGGTVPSGQAVSFPNSGTYTLSESVTFGAMTLLAPELLFDLPSPTESGKTLSCASFSFGAGDLNAEISGGRLISSGEFHVGAIDATTKARNNTLTLKNGAFVSAAETYVSNKRTGNTLKVIESSTLDVSGNVLMGVNANGDNAIEVRSGGKILVGNNFQDGSFTAAKYRTLSPTANSVLVDGAGTEMTVGNRMMVGAVYCDNSFEVANGAEVTVGERLYVGGAATATNNRFTVSGGSSVSAENLVIGDSATNSLFCLTGGSTAVFSSDAYVGGYQTAGVDSRLEICNSSFTCEELKMGMAAGRKSKVLISGAQSQLSITRKGVPRYPLFSAGSGHEFILDGARWHHSDISLQFDAAAENCSLRLENGAVFVSDGGLYSGTNSTFSCGNVFYVGDGSSFTGQFLRISRCDNSVVISNGCCVLVSEADSRNTGLRIGDLLDNVTEVRGNGLVLQGQSPKVRSAKEVRITNESFLRFDIPAEGLAGDNVPVICSRLVIDDVSRLEATGVYEHSHIIGNTVTYVLAEAAADNIVSIPQSVIEAANSDLREQGCRRSFFSVSADGRQLCLTVRPAFDGLKVVIR